MWTWFVQASHLPSSWRAPRWIANVQQCWLCPTLCLGQCTAVILAQNIFSAIGMRRYWSTVISEDNTLRVVHLQCLRIPHSWQAVKTENLRSDWEHRRIINVCVLTLVKATRCAIYHCCLRRCCRGEEKIQLVILIWRDIASRSRVTVVLGALNSRAIFDASPNTYCPVFRPRSSRSNIVNDVAPSPDGCQFCNISAKAGETLGWSASVQKLRQNSLQSFHQQREWARSQLPQAKFRSDKTAHHQYCKQKLLSHGYSGWLILNVLRWLLLWFQLTKLLNL